MVKSVVTVAKKRHPKRLDAELQKLFDALDDIDRRAAETDRRIEERLRNLDRLARRIREAVGR